MSSRAGGHLVDGGASSRVRRRMTAAWMSVWTRNTPAGPTRDSTQDGSLMLDDDELPRGGAMMRHVRAAAAVSLFTFLTGCPIPGGSHIEQWWPEGETLEVTESTHAAVDGTITYTDEVAVVRYSDASGNVWEVEYDLEPYE